MYFKNRLCLMILDRGCFFFFFFFLFFFWGGRGGGVAKNIFNIISVRHHYIPSPKMMGAMLVLVQTPLALA